MFGSPLARSYIIQLRRADDETCRQLKGVPMRCADCMFLAFVPLPEGAMQRVCCFRPGYEVVFVYHTFCCFCVS